MDKTVISLPLPKCQKRRLTSDERGAGEPNPLFPQGQNKLPASLLWAQETLLSLVESGADDNFIDCNRVTQAGIPILRDLLPI